MAPQRILAICRIVLQVWPRRGREHLAVAPGRYGPWRMEWPVYTGLVLVEKEAFSV